VGARWSDIRAERGGDEVVASIEVATIEQVHAVLREVHRRLRDWEGVWDTLWRLGIKWEWQNSDRYARRRGDRFNLFAVHNDAQRLDMSVPLPGIEVIGAMENWLLGAHIDNSLASEALNIMKNWRKKHVG